MSNAPQRRFVTRGGDKLDAALDGFGINVAGLTCADLGSHAGGFVDCLLQRGAARVYSIDTAYGVLAWTLRKDPRVVVLERTNALHVQLPEKVDLVTIDVGWTRQSAILPAVREMLNPTPSARVVTLIKPHYEARPDELNAGVLPDEAVERIVVQVLEGVASLGWTSMSTFQSPIRGHGGNREVFALFAAKAHRPSEGG